MLSHSYRSFLIMDQLRRRAGISVPQLNSVLGFSETNYSRISKRVYNNESGVLQGVPELRVARMVKVLAKGYHLKVLFETTLKRPDIDMMRVLGDLSKTLQVATCDDLKDACVDKLLSAAGAL